MLRTAPNCSNSTNRVSAHSPGQLTFDVIAGFVGIDEIIRNFRRILVTINSNQQMLGCNYFESCLDQD